MGVTTGGTIGRRVETLDDCVVRIQAIADAARGATGRPLICHGGPISERPTRRTHLEVPAWRFTRQFGRRLPAERAIAEQIRMFKRIRLPAPAPAASRGGAAR